MSSKTVPTPHINAKSGDFAPTVLMSGDPVRAKFIAETFLTNAHEVTNVRGMLGFTGQYQGKPLSVMGHGMGMPSCSIYTTELYKFYDVENIIRIGSCGAIHPDIHLRDVIIAMGASTDSNINRQRFNNYDFAALADYSLLEQLVASARALNIHAKVGNVFTTDLFYGVEDSTFKLMADFGILGVEMEAAALFRIAAEHKKKAAALFTVSDHIIKGEALSSEARATSFNEMIEIALNTALSIES